MDLRSPAEDRRTDSSVASSALSTSVHALSERAIRHRAVHHPFLQAFAAGDFGPRTLEVARTYARWYDGYSKWFPRYLRAVIARLPREDHQELLGENLAEEQGQLCPDERGTLIELGIDPASVDGVPHPELFARFRRAVGLSDTDVATPPLPTIEWRSGFHGMLRAGSAAYGVGALGLGTETVVSTIYPYILEGLKRIDSLSREDIVFFELHCHVDDQHQLDLLQIAIDLAGEGDGLAELERGMNDALELRADFWDALHAGCLERPRIIHGA